MSDPRARQRRRLFLDRTLLPARSPSNVRVRIQVAAGQICSLLGSSELAVPGAGRRQEVSCDGSVPARRHLGAFSGTCFADAQRGCAAIHVSSVNASENGFVTLPSLPRPSRRTTSTRSPSRPPARPHRSQASGAVCPELWTPERDRVRFRTSPAAPNLWRSCGLVVNISQVLTRSYGGARPQDRSAAWCGQNGRGCRPGPPSCGGVHDREGVHRGDRR